MRSLLTMALLLAFACGVAGCGSKPIEKKENPFLGRAVKPIPKKGR